MNMFSQLFSLIKKYVPLHLAVFAIACCPFIEVKGSIPLGVIAGLPVWQSSFWAYLGSMLPVPFILSGFNYILAFLKIWHRTMQKAEKLEADIYAKRDLIDRYGYLGLFVFVALPIPGTGVWSGALLASLLKLKYLPSLILIALGNAVGTCLIYGLTFGVSSLFKLFF